MPTKPISQREARRLRKRVDELECALKVWENLIGKDVLQERVRQYNALTPEAIGVTRKTGGLKL
jgi:hypothetical protein